MIGEEVQAAFYHTLARIAGKRLAKLRRYLVTDRSYETVLAIGGTVGGEAVNLLGKGELSVAPDGTRISAPQLVPTVALMLSLLSARMRTQVTEGMIRQFQAGTEIDDQFGEMAKALLDRMSRESPAKGAVTWSGKVEDVGA